MAKEQLQASLKHSFISVIIVCRPTETPSKALRSLAHISYPRQKFEVFVIKGSHVSKQRNIAIEEANGSIIYLLDNDSQVQPHALTLIEQAFKNKQIAAVGGPSISPVNEEIYISKIIGYILETHFGGLRMRFRYSKNGTKRSADEFDLIGANLALRKKAIQQVGGFDETLFPNEETELLVRLKRKGYFLYYHPELFVFRSHRKTLPTLWKQFFFYGKGRAMQMDKTHATNDVIFIIPILFLFYVVSLLFFGKLWWYDIPIFAYLTLAVATALKASLKYKKIDLLFLMPVIFPIIHFAYACGLLTQLLRLVFLKPYEYKKAATHIGLEMSVSHRSNTSRK